MRAVTSAARRWGPVQPAPDTLVTLHFSPRAAPYVRARPWHTAVDTEVWSDGGLRVSVDAGRAQLSAVHDLLRRLVVLHGQRPLRAVLFGRGFVPA